MASFATFAVGYLARPIGGIVLSHYGDRYGRRARVPVVGVRHVGRDARHGTGARLRAVGRRGQRADGDAAPVQGFCLGGELPGALTYVVETAPRIAPFVCGVVFACVTMGVAVATGVSLSRSHASGSGAGADLRWRIAFVLGGLGGVLSFVLAPLARRIAGVRAHAQPGVAPAVPRAAADPPRARSSSAARCSPAPAASTASSSRTCRLSLGRAAVRPAPGRALADRRRDRLRRSASSSPAGWAIASRRAICCARASGCCWCLRFRFTPRSRSRALNLTLLCTLAGLGAGLTNGSFAVLLTDLVPDAHPLYRRRAGLQRQLHDLQRHGAARRDDVD